MNILIFAYTYIDDIVKKLLFLMYIGLLAVSCSDTAPGIGVDDDNNDSDSTEVSEQSNVSIVISTSHGNESRQSITGDEIKSIKIYAFQSGVDNATPVGFIEDNNLQSKTPPYTYKMDLTDRGALDFFAFINDGALEPDDNNTGIEEPVILDENLTLGEASRYRITGEFKQYTDGGYAIPMSNLEGENGANRKFVVKETSSPQSINLSVTRALSRLNLYFAKHNTGSHGDVRINSAVLYQGPVSTRLAVKEDVSSLSEFYKNGNDEPINVLSEAVTVESVISNPDEELTKSNCTHICTAYMLENPYGATGNNTDNNPDGTLTGDDENSKTYKLTINYSVGANNNKTKDIYLPAVERNQTINVFGLLKGEDISIQISVARWLVEDISLIDYPTYNDCIPKEGTYEYVTDARFVDSNNQTEKEEKAVAVRFNIDSPEGLRFTPALVNNGNFEIKVYDSAGQDVTDKPDRIVSGGSGLFTIYVIPTAPFDENNSENNYTELVISTTTWAGPNDLLLINRKKEWNKNQSPLEDRIKISLVQ